MGEEDLNEAPSDGLKETPKKLEKRRPSRKIIEAEIQHIVKDTGDNKKQEPRESANKKIQPQNVARLPTIDSQMPVSDFGGNSSSQGGRKKRTFKPYVDRFEKKQMLKQRIYNFCQYLLVNKLFQGLQLIATLVALFGSDVATAFLSPSMYGGLGTLYLAILFFFFFEMAVKAYAEDRYFLSFYFFMDLLGTISIIADITPNIGLLINDIEDTNMNTTLTDISEEDRLDVLRAGRLVRTGARTTRVLRLLRVLRFARLLRALRLVNIFRLYYANRTLKQMKSEEEVPSKLGLSLADLLGRRNVIMILVIVFALPQLEVQIVDKSLEQGINILANPARWKNNVTRPIGAELKYLVERDSQVAEFGESFVLLKEEIMQLNQNAIELAVNGFILHTSSLIQDKDHERYLVLWQAESYGSFIIQDIYALSQTEAAYNILLNIILISMLGVSGYLFTNDVNRTIVVPIVKTTEAIKKLAKTLFILTTEDDEDDSEENDLSLQYSFVNSIVEQLTTFFDIEKDKPSFFRKTLRRSSTASIVSTAAPVPKTNKRVLSPRDLISSDRVKCLQSLKLCWEDKKALQYFKVYLTSEFAVESLIFIQKIDQIDEIKKQTKKLICEIVNNFVKTTATAQVNISDDQRNFILGKDMNTLDFEHFNPARTEIFNQLERDNFTRFKISKLAKDLLELKKKDLKEYQMLKDSTEPSEESRPQKMTFKKMLTTKLIKMSR
eukprot:augustus_masked-scaffold_2-processed-gene-3.35-mRNA-1 protein AED:1.00 eAED:1.00 QI:0/-1/0/0/-1/1/1/0/722